jgi:hypothetical protein
MAKANKSSFINAHTHVFTKEHSPKYLAKQMLPKPLYKWFPTVPLVKIIKCYLKAESEDYFIYIPFRKFIRCYLNRNKDEKEVAKEERKSLYSYTERNKKHKAYLDKKNRRKAIGKLILNVIRRTIIWVIFLFYLSHLILPFIKGSIVGWLCSCYLKVFTFMPTFGPWTTAFLLLAMTLLFKTIRAALKSYIKGKFIKAIGKEKLDFLLRYINIARFSSHSGMAYIFNQLKQQYPIDSKFVVLPMDMEYMDAGPVEEPYPKQMEKLIELKNKKQNKDILLPFIFVDPRRIAEHGKAFLNLNTSNPDNIVLEDCQVKDYIDGGCAGIKIYPALGYYVFDKNMLPLWLYCTQNDIPITTHCSIGPVFYRGKLKDLGEDYDYHPIFDEVYEKEDDEDHEENKDDTNGEEITGQLRFHELKNKDFQKNFTHPLNYLCLIHEPLLIKVIETFDENNDLKDLFGYKDDKITRNLNKLKINLAHYGSAEMWDKFLEKDRYAEANAIIQDSEKGLDLIKNIGSRAKRYSYWHYMDWFSIISTMMMQFDNLYTDVSYTAHDLKYLSLLSEILDHPKISKRVLFGTDFYVVSNHKTEKQYWIDMQNSLGEEKWNKIARENPTRFLTSKLPGTI